MNNFHSRPFYLKIFHQLTKASIEYLLHLTILSLFFCNSRNRSNKFTYRTVNNLRTGNPLKEDFCVTSMAFASQCSTDEIYLIRHIEVVGYKSRPILEDLSI